MILSPEVTFGNVWIDFSLSLEEGASGISWGEAQLVAGKHPIMHGTALHKKE